MISWKAASNCFCICLFPVSSLPYYRTHPPQRHLNIRCFTSVIQLTFSWRNTLSLSLPPSPPSSTHLSAYLPICLSLLPHLYLGIEITIRVDESDCLSMASSHDQETERFLSTGTMGRRVSFNEAALFDHGKKAQEKGRRSESTNNTIIHGSPHSQMQFLSSVQLAFH